MSARCGKRTNAKSLPRVHFLNTLCIKNFDEVTVSRTVKEIEGNLCFAIFGKNSKIQNVRQMWEEDKCQKFAKSTFLKYFVSKIATKSLYLARLRR